MTTADEERARLLDQIALVDALADYASASAARELAEATLVRLARRLTERWELTDAEAVRVAGREALLALAKEKRP